MLFTNRFNRLVVLFLLALLLLAPAGVQAIPSADLLYIETDLGGGWWQYDYTLYSIRDDSAEDNGYNIWDVTFVFDSEVAFIGLSLPYGWSSSVGWIDAEPADSPDGIFEEVSTSFAVALSEGSSSDVLPGESLGFFSFMINSGVSGVGDISFDYTMSDPNNSDYPLTFETNPYQVDGGTRQEGAAVPEPGTLLLLGTGLTFMLVMIRIRRFRFR